MEFLFVGTECGPVEWNLILKDTPNVLPVIELPEVTDVAFRTNVIAYTYFVLCCIWVVTSVMLIRELKISVNFNNQFQSFTISPYTKKLNSKFSGNNNIFW